MLQSRVVLNRQTGTEARNETLQRGKKCTIFHPRSHKSHNSQAPCNKSVDCNRIPERRTHRGQPRNWQLARLLIRAGPLASSRE